MAKTAAALTMTEAARLLGRKGGQAKSDRKTQAVRENARKPRRKRKAA
jgi:hypothetical protein